MTLGKSTRPYLRNKLKQKDWDMTHMVEYLLTKGEALSSKLKYCQKEKLMRTECYLYVIDVHCRILSAICCDLKLNVD
jgi:hypothetical protein